MPRTEGTGVSRTAVVQESPYTAPRQVYILVPKQIGGLATARTGRFGKRPYLVGPASARTSPIRVNPCSSVEE